MRVCVCVYRSLHTHISRFNLFSSLIWSLNHGLGDFYFIFSSNKISITNHKTFTIKPMLGSNFQLYGCVTLKIHNKLHKLLWKLPLPCFKAKIHYALLVAYIHVCMCVWCAVSMCIRFDSSGGRIMTGQYSTACIRTYIDERRQCCYTENER